MTRDIGAGRSLAAENLRTENSPQVSEGVLCSMSFQVLEGRDVAHVSSRPPLLNHSADLLPAGVEERLLG